MPGSPSERRIATPPASAYKGPRLKLASRAADRLACLAVVLTPSRALRLPWWTLAGAVLLAAWLFRVVLLFRDFGLFRVIGGDWSMYYAQALVLRSGAPQSLYDLAASDVFLQTLRAYTTDPSQPLPVGPVAYPPIFAWLMVPFTLPPPPIGFALWTLLNVAAVALLAYRVAQVLPQLSRTQAFVGLLVSVPVAQGLIVGQPTALLACAVAEWYLAMRQGRDVRAGLWLALLLLKPQYGILIGPLLLWKRRWGVVGGVALGGLLLVALSALVVGPSTLWTYGSAIADIAPWGGAAVASPGQMINWRGLILNLRPSIGPLNGVLLTSILGLLSVLCLFPAWRGRWSAESPTFAPRMAALLLITVLANYHSHVHGLALAALPVAACAWAANNQPRDALDVGGAGGPAHGAHHRARSRTPARTMLGRPVDALIWSPLMQVLLVAASGALVVDAMRLRARTAQHEFGPSPVKVGAASVPPSPA